MKTETGFNPMTDRYEFDFKLCTPSKGWAQVDTSQDAGYFGTWANPEKLEIVNYCEGDITLRTAESGAEFAQALRELKAWNEERGYGFGGIDCAMVESIKEDFEELGLGDLLH